MLQIYGFILKTGQKFSNFAAMTKKNTIIIRLLAALCLIDMVSACDRQRNTRLEDYTVSCTLDGKLQHDSATLLVLDENYNKLRLCGTAHVQNGSVTFCGQTDGPKVALIRWDNDTIHPFHFVLESGHITLKIQPESWSVAGSCQNLDYQDFINRRNAILNQRVTTWQEYLKASADATLTREDELRMVRQDSLLNDSLQRLTVDRINRGDAVGRIIRERFAGQLDQKHARQLKH